MSVATGPVVFVVAGEASADNYGALLIQELKSQRGDLSFVGVGGEKMRAQGLSAVIDASEISVVGVSDWLDRAREVVGAYHKVVRAVTSNPPAVAVLLDLPDFNLRLAKHLRAAGVPVVYYISPQVWAWRQYRVHKIRRLVQKMLVVFPFEKDFYQRHNVPAEFVGHPLLELLPPPGELRSASDVAAAPRVALLPGSRRSELKYHLPMLREVAVGLIRKFPTIEIRVPVASTLQAEQVQKVFASAPQVKVVRGGAWEVMRWADVGAVASGTATLEAALLGLPFLLFYRLSASSSFFFKHVFRYRNFLGMANLLHRRPVVPEYFQERAEPHGILEKLTELLNSHALRAQMRGDLLQCRDMLGQQGASARAAHAVLKSLPS